MANPTNRDFKKNFDILAKEYDHHSNQYTTTRRLNSIDTIMSGIVLEVGSGTGLIRDYTKNIIISTDISFQMCKEIKKKNPMTVCCDAEQLPFRQNTIDQIISLEMIYYLQNPENFIKCANQILKNNGNIFISMVNSKMTFLEKIRLLLVKKGIKGVYVDGV